MNHVFSTIIDVRRYANDQMEGYCHSDYGCETHEDLIDRLAGAIRNAEGFSYGEDMSDLLDSLYDEQDGWTPVLDGGESN